MSQCGEKQYSQNGHVHQQQNKITTLVLHRKCQNFIRLLKIVQRSGGLSRKGSIPHECFTCNTCSQFREKREIIDVHVNLRKLYIWGSAGFVLQSYLRIGHDKIITNYDLIARCIYLRSATISARVVSKYLIMSFFEN